MTRIIAGVAGGRRLATPPGDSTRPTSDRVREAIFSALESHLGSWSGVRFLDLFAGSGAVGLEAVSRGASCATLVEHHRRAAAVARRNAATLGLSGIEVVTARAEAYVARHRDAAVAGADPGTGPPGCFDVVFLDPPYDFGGDAVTALLRELVLARVVCAEGVVVVERSARDDPLVWPDGLAGDRSKRYGETLVWYGHATERQPPG